MTNGVKRKNKKSEESEKKVGESYEQKLTKEREARAQLDARRAIIEANVNRARMEQEKQIQIRNALHMKMNEWAKEKVEEQAKAEGLRAADNKRRDSLGGSVSTSSNSSGTDTDEVLSDAAKSAVTSPISGVNEAALAASRRISEEIASIHNQVAQSVVDAGTEEALSTLSEFLPYTMTGKNKNKKKANAALAELREDPAVSSSPSPVARQVVTPILSGGKTTPSAELAAFRSISDDHPGEIPGACPTEGDKPVIIDLDKFGMPTTRDPKTDTEPFVPSRFPILPSNFSLDNPRSSFERNGKLQSNDFFHDLIQAQYNQQLTNPANAQHNGYGARSDYSIFDKITRENVRDRPDAYNACMGGKARQGMDMVAAHEATVRMEKESGLWLKGERAVLKNIFDDIPKLLAKQPVPWIRNLLQLIFDAKPKKVHNRMRVMASLLRHRGGFEQCSDLQIYQHIATVLLEAGTNAELGYSYVHVLSAQGSHQKSCCDESHRRCLTLQMVLAPLSAESLQKALSLKVREWRHRNPVHFATATGEPCQLDALQKFRPDFTMPDEQGATPILYAVLRDNLFMLRQLTWYGADTMQTCDKLGHSALDWKNVTGKMPLGKTCEEFIRKRNGAFERIIKKWMSEIATGLIFKKGLSEVHTLDCRQPSDQMIEKIKLSNEVMNIPHWIGHINKTVHFKLRPNILNEDRGTMFLLIIPFTYLHTDFTASADQPEISRRTLFYDDEDTLMPMIGGEKKLRPIQFMSEPPFINVKDPHSNRPPIQKALVPLLLAPNTGTFWAYKIPSDVFSHECLWVTMALDLCKVNVSLRDNLRLLIQVVSMQQKQHN